MKKIICSLTIGVIIMFALGVISFASDSAEVTVSVFDENGKAAVCMETINAGDEDSDGIITVNDVLIATHNKFYEGGAELGYKSEESTYGLSLIKLWGYDNGVAYGYYVNNAMAMSLLDEVKNGDYISAFIYRDTEFFSDVYTFFGDVSEKEECVSLTLYSLGFDENRNTVRLPLEGAEIIVNGKATGIKTDSTGKCTVSFDESGEFIISATYGDGIIVAPVYKINIEKGTYAVTETIADIVTDADVDTFDTTEAITEEKKIAPQTGDVTVVILAMIIVSSLAIIAYKKNND